jgi:hypothetical protein
MTLWLKTMLFGLRWTIWDRIGRDASKLPRTNGVYDIQHQSEGLLEEPRNFKSELAYNVDQVEEMSSQQLDCYVWCSKPAHYFRFRYEGSTDLRLGYTANLSSSGIFHGPFTDRALGRSTVEQLRANFLASERPFMTAFSRVLEMTESLKWSFLQLVRPLPTSGPYWSYYPRKSRC